MSAATGRPWVRLHVGQSVDGKIAAPGQKNASLGGACDARAIARARAWADAIVLGAKTIRDADVPVGLKASPAVAERRRARGQAPQPLAVLLCGSGHLPPAARVFRQARRPLVAVGQGAPAAAIARWQEAAEVWRAPCQCPGAPHAAGVCLPRLLTCLWRRGVRRLLLEGGGTTAWSFVAEGALDEVCCTVVPCLLGGARAPTPLDGAGLAFAAQWPLQLRRLRLRRGLLFLRYRVLPKRA